MTDIEDADIVVDLTGGKSAAQKYRKQIADLKADNERLREALGEIKQRLINLGEARYDKISNGYAYATLGDYLSRLTDWELDLYRLCRDRLKENEK